MLPSWKEFEPKIKIKNNSGLNAPDEFYKLDKSTQQKLLDWVNSNLTEMTG